MGGILGGGGGGGGSGGDETNTTEKALPSPAQIAATRAAFNTASGISGAARNLPYFAQIASSPAYRQSLQDTANTWSDWMGHAPVDLSEGAAPITQGQFGSVIDAGAGMNNQIAQMDPGIQYMLSQWVGPGPTGANSPYAPAIYDPYVQQKPLLHQGTAAQGGVGTIGAGGIPTSTIPPGVLDPTTPPPTTPPPTTPPPGTGGGGQIVHMGGRTYRRRSNGRYVQIGGFGRGTGGGQGGMGQGGFAARGGNPGQFGSTGPTLNDI